MVEVPEISVGAIEQFHTIFVPESVQVPEPIIKVAVLVELLLNCPVVTLYVTASNVPVVRVRVLVAPKDSASASWTVPDGWLMVTLHPN